jgi:hypothetical protein
VSLLCPYCGQGRGPQITRCRSVIAILTIGWIMILPAWTPDQKAAIIAAISPLLLVWLSGI